MFKCDVFEEVLVVDLFLKKNIILRKRSIFKKMVFWYFYLSRGNYKSINNIKLYNSGVTIILFNRLVTHFDNG